MTFLCGQSLNLHYHVDSSFDHKETSSVIIILTICIHNLVVAEGSWCSVAEKVGENDSSLQPD